MKGTSCKLGLFTSYNPFNFVIKLNLHKKIFSFFLLILLIIEYFCNPNQFISGFCSSKNKSYCVIISLKEAIPFLLRTKSITIKVFSLLTFCLIIFVSVEL